MNLNTTIDFDLIGFFRWWGGELAFLVPQRVKTWLREDHGCFVLRPAAPGFDVEFLAGGRRDASPHASIGDANAFIQFLRQCPNADKADIVLRLPADKTLSRTIHLPLAAAENLQQVVAFELDRYTPFTTDQVYFAAVPQDKTEFEQIRVRLILTPRIYLDEQLTLLRAWSVMPGRVECDQGDEALDGVGSYNLLPPQYRQPQKWWLRSAHAVLWAVIGLLTAAVLVVPAWMESQAVDMIKQQIAILDKPTKAVEAQQLEIDALRDETQKLIDLKQQSPSLLLVLNELSRLLNDETWLTHFQYSDKHLQIQGQSRSASALISVLESSPSFANVSFVSPLTQDKATGRERFQIGMDVNVVVPAVEPETNDDADITGVDDASEIPAELEPNGEEGAILSLEPEDAPNE